MPTPTIHRLKITLRHMRPPIWRRLEIPSQASLTQLHQYIQTAFAWFDCHLHEFDIAGARYGADEGDQMGGWGDPPLDEAGATLAKLAPARSTFVYTYDFGDDWEHTIKVEAIEPAAKDILYPRCTAGRRAAPPEDVGGAWGYAEFIEALANADHPEHDERVEWYDGEDFDPSAFDLDDINHALHALTTHTNPGSA